MGSPLPLTAQCGRLTVDLGQKRELSDANLTSLGPLQKGVYSYIAIIRQSLTAANDVRGLRRKLRREQFVTQAADGRIPKIRPFQLRISGLEGASPGLSIPPALERGPLRALRRLGAICRAVTTVMPPPKVDAAEVRTLPTRASV